MPDFSNGTPCMAIQTAFLPLGGRPCNWPLEFQLCPAHFHMTRPFAKLWRPFLTNRRSQPKFASYTANLRFDNEALQPRMPGEPIRIDFGIRELYDEMLMLIKPFATAESSGDHQLCLNRIFNDLVRLMNTQERTSP